MWALDIIDDKLDPQAVKGLVRVPMGVLILHRPTYSECS